MPLDVGSEAFHIEVKHHSPLPNRYTWQIHRPGKELPISESKGEYGSWEEASQAGKRRSRSGFVVGNDRQTAVSFRPSDSEGHARFGRAHRRYEDRASRPRSSISWMRPAAASRQNAPAERNSRRVPSIRQTAHPPCSSFVLRAVICRRGPAPPINGPGSF